MTPVNSNPFVISRYHSVSRTGNQSLEQQLQQLEVLIDHLTRSINPAPKTFTKTCHEIRALMDQIGKSNIPLELIRKMARFQNHLNVNR